jgi:hypothetical protein
MTMQFPVADQTMVNLPSLRSRAEWTSPGYDDEVFAEGLPPMAPDAPPSRWFADPPPADGRKVIITDTDHSPGKADPLWAWAPFLRGHHPILMDLGLIGGPANRPVIMRELPGPPPFEPCDPTRYAMSDTRRFTGREDLIDMEPGGDLSSTECALVNPGNEYLISSRRAAAHVHGRARSRSLRGRVDHRARPPDDSW